MNLGRKMEGPTAPNSIEVEIKAEEPKVYYPSLYVEGLPESLGVSGEGTATVKFKVVSETKKTRDGKTTFCYDIEIQDFAPKGGKSKKSDEEELDELRDKVTKKG